MEPEFAGRSLIRDLRLLIVLFVMLRLVTALVYQPNLFDVYGADGKPYRLERGLSTWGDMSYHYDIAALSDKGLLPYRDFWYEYPPLFPALSVGLYRLLSVSAPAPYPSWVTAWGVILTLFDLGVLLLIRRIAARLYGAERATELAWVYALLPMPLILNWWTFDGMIAFFLLLGLALLLEGQAARSGAAIAAGILLKFVPAALLPAVWRFRPRREAVICTALALGITAIVLAGAVLAFGDNAVSSLTVQFTKSSYATVWALLDGNLHTGIFTGDHFAPPAPAPRDHPAVIPAWLTLLVFGGIGLFVFTRRLRRDDRGVVAFVGITYMLFLLWSPAWSNQWLMWIAPLVLLCFPTRTGVMTVLLLGLVTFVEYPMLFGRTGDTGGVIAGALALPYYVTVISRAVIWAALAVGMYRLLTEREP